MNSSPSITKIAPALLAAQKTMGNATKDAKNPYYKSNYADLNSVREVATPALNAQGITILQPTVVVNDKNYVETVLLHESGELITALTEIKNPKGDAQSEGSGISYARRYGLQSLLNIGAVDDDAEKTMTRAEVQTTETTKKPGRPTKTVETKTTTPTKETPLPTVTNGNGAGKVAPTQVEEEW